MGNQSQFHFIVIDDDATNNHICTRCIQIVFPGADVQTFTDPQKGLEYIQTKYPLQDEIATILFLDINMPFLTGWDVLERYGIFPEETKKQIKIFILSSSVAIEDKQKAHGNLYVSGFIEKPLSLTQLQTMLQGNV